MMPKNDYRISFHYPQNTLLIILNYMAKGVKCHKKQEKMLLSHTEQYD